MNVNFIKSIFLFAVVAIFLSACKNEPFEWEDTNGPAESTIEMVDLGLSVKWATCNVGAILPWQCGNYYSWGEISTKHDYNYEASCVTLGKSVGNISGNYDYDAARAVWGGKWRLPTKEEFEELINECYWSSYKSYLGRKIYNVRGPNGNEINFPATGYYSSEFKENMFDQGYYWCSTPSNDNIGEEVKDYYAYSLYLDSNNNNIYKTIQAQVRTMGLCIRPVSD